MHCHSTENPLGPRGGAIALVGHPNVGKSVIFHRLTGQRVAVSNYPGTTVELARGQVSTAPGLILVDTPGLITFPPHSEDEQVTARVLLEEKLQGIVQVGDAKNLRRTLLLSLQLVEMGLPMVLALNMMDEAAARGVEVDQQALEAALGVPVVPTTAVRGAGVDRLLTSLEAFPAGNSAVEYPPAINAFIHEFEALFQPPAGGEGSVYVVATPIAPRALALLFLSGDEVSEGWLRGVLSAEDYSRLGAQRRELEVTLPGGPAAAIQNSRQRSVERIARLAMINPGLSQQSLPVRLGRLSTHPVWGFLVLGGILAALYWFVGIFGAGTLVGLLENRLFGEVINPWFTGLVQRLLPWKFAADFLIGEYGLWTMGMTYALALILPIVTTFFLAFGVLEDSGYLPRLAAFSNRMFEFLGLNGKAVLPMVLGLGCVTMATLTTRVLESKRERLMVTLLLALAVPCSAQLGVVMGMLAGISLTAFLLWGGFVLLVMAAVGWLAARVVPGERVALLVELPPLRVPQLSNVVVKTLARLEWYIKEVIPLFLFGAALMFALDKTGILGILTRAGEPLVTGWLGLPPQASAAFLMGFLRRDFGATGLFVMQSHGLLTPTQAIVAMVTITLFVPCIASVMMMAKERGWKAAAGILAVVFPLAILVGGLLNRLLILSGWLS